jgi:hypothetical protein
LECADLWRFSHTPSLTGTFSRTLFAKAFDPLAPRLHYQASMRDCIRLGVVVGTSLLFFATAVSEQVPTRTISLWECIELAITRNYDV